MTSGWRSGRREARRRARKAQPARAERLADRSPEKAGYDRPVPDVRYRCTSCGNLTRFDVTTTRRTRAFHHYSVGGELSVEDVEVLDETVEDVSCRWCGSGAAVVEEAVGEPVTPPS